MMREKEQREKDMQTYYNNQVNTDNYGQNKSQFMQNMRDNQAHNFIQKSQNNYYQSNNQGQYYEPQQQYNYQHVAHQRPYQNYGTPASQRPPVAGGDGCCCSIM